MESGRRARPFTLSRIHSVSCAGHPGHEFAVECSVSVLVPVVLDG